MHEFYSAVALFVFTHLLPAIRPLRQAAIDRIGRTVYFAVFSTVSVAATMWLFMAYLNAPYVEAWSYQPWTRWAVLLAMPFACILIVAGLSTPNPFSLSLNTSSFDGTRPGIVALTRHPVIWGLGLWSSVHMLPNGDAAGLTLFGLLTLLCLTGPRTLERRRQTALGDDAWQSLRCSVIRLGPVDLVRQIGAVRIVAGLVLYVVLLLAHGPVIRVSPLDG